MARVLLVDDDDVVRALSMRMLEHAHHTVRCARSGVEALEELSQGNFDIVVTDIVMDEMDGFELIRAIRTINTVIPIVALSSSEPYLHLGLHLGANRALLKPLRPGQLARACADYVLVAHRT